MKLLAAAAATTALLATTALPAGAHTPKVHADCETGLTVTLSSYEKGTTVTINGTTYDVGTSKFSKNFPTTYTYQVTVDNKGDGWDKGDKFDAQFQGEAEDCVPPPTTTTTAPEAPPTTQGNPATPVCSFPGKGRYNFNDPECKADVSVPPVVEAPAPAAEPVAAPAAEAPVPAELAFTGPMGNTEFLLVVGAFLILAGITFVTRAGKDI